MIPRAFLKDDRYAGISPHAMILYGMLRDRSLMSERRTRFTDEHGAYVIYRRDDICSALHCGHDKAGKILNELESFGLISTKQQGHNKPNKYYVENLLTDICISDIRPSKKQTSGRRLFGIPNVGKQDRSYTELNYTDYSQTESSQSDGGFDPKHVEALIKENIEYDVLLEKDEGNKERLSELIDIMVDTVCGDSETVTIGKANQPRNRVRERFINFDSGSMLYVLDRLKKNKSKVRNIRAYLLTVLFNAPVTVNNYYDAEVQHDLRH